MKIKEDVPTNNASSGLVAGLGNSPTDPPMKKKRKLNDILTRKQPEMQTNATKIKK
jgi:hypothetical protein